MPAIIPYLGYDDAPAAIDFLTSAFGFRERYRIDMPDGRVGHCELELGDSLLYLASAYPEIGVGGPKDLPYLHAQILCQVDDVDAHYVRARQAGAIVVGEPEDQAYGDRSYRASDPEGMRWIFSQHLHDVAEADIKAAYE